MQGKVSSAGVFLRDDASFCPTIGLARSGYRPFRGRLRNTRRTGSGSDLRRETLRTNRHPAFEGRPTAPFSSPVAPSLQFFWSAIMHNHFHSNPDLRPAGERFFVRSEAGEDVPLRRIRLSDTPEFFFINLL